MDAKCNNSFLDDDLLKTYDGLVNPDARNVKIEC